MQNHNSILITGATSGFGEAIARVLAKMGTSPITLHLGGRREDRLLQLKKELETNHVQVFTHRFDIRDSEAVLKFSQEQKSHLKSLNVLINNAGLAAGLSTLQEGDLADWEAMIDTNIKGLLYMTRAILPYFLENGAGHIINIGSVAGREVYPKGNVYCATKHAVAALTEAMRLDTLGKNIRVTNIEPGKAETEFSLVRFKGDAEKAKAEYTGMRALHPEDVAEAVLWCLSRPAHVNVQEILLMPTDQASARDVYRTNLP